MVDPNIYTGCEDDPCDLANVGSLSTGDAVKVCVDGIEVLKTFAEVADTDTDTFVTITDNTDGTASVTNADGTDGACLLTCDYEPDMCALMASSTSNGLYIGG